MDAVQPRAGTRRAVGACVAAVLAGLAAAPAAAAAPPAPCGGVPQITDTVGDGHHDNTDVIAGWLSEEAGRVQAVIQVHFADWVSAHDVTETAGWAFLFRSGSDIRYVRLEAPGQSPLSYDHGTWTAAGGFVSAGATAGVTETGTRGAVTIDVPGIAAGTVLAQPFILTYDGVAPIHWVDRGPGGEGPSGTEVGADYVAGSCGAAPPPGGGPAPISAVQLDAPRRVVGGGRRTIRGRVVPAQAGVPVKLTAQTIRSSTRNLTTAADGTFSVRLRISEKTRLRAEAGGIGSQTLTVAVKSKVRIKARRLKDGDVRIAGRVWPALPGRALLLRSSDVAPRARTRPKKSGRFAFRFEHLPRGRYEVVFVPSRGRAQRSTSNRGVVR
jgi:hypothetical protein